RRLLERDGAHVLEKNAGEAMNRSPKTITAEELAVHALSIMEEKKITSLVVIDSEQKIQGVVHLHDLWETELI
ncbi:MAG TPA: CBS domain-containing protein, partial [Alloacidobacterium sp.]|nr:CBS domain-containing protein [Alloacidobacterium sp.]